MPFEAARICAALIVVIFGFFASTVTALVTYLLHARKFELPPPRDQLIREVMAINIGMILLILLDCITTSWAVLMPSGFPWPLRYSCLAIISVFFLRANLRLLLDHFRKQ